jgi:hypothetical protein
MPRRSIDTAIWNDDRFAGCSPEAKLTYVRLVTGDDTGPAGATRVHSRRLAADTGLTTKRVERAVDELADTGLVRRYDGGWLWMPTWIRYQVAGPAFCRAVRRQARDCPDALRKAIGRALDEHAPQKPPDTERTETVAASRQNVEGPPDTPETVTGQSGDPSGGGTGPGPGPGPDPIPLRGNGISGPWEWDAEAAATPLGGGPPASHSRVNGEAQPMLAAVRPDPVREAEPDDDQGEPLSGELVSAMALTSPVMAALAERRRLAELAELQRVEPAEPEDEAP